MNSLDYFHKSNKISDLYVNIGWNAYGLGEKRINFHWVIYTVLQILRVRVIEQVDILQLVSNSVSTIPETYTGKQLNLFDLQLDSSGFR